MTLSKIFNLKKLCRYENIYEQMIMSIYFLFHEAKDREKERKL